jgi:hypothetical protein
MLITLISWIFISAICLVWGNIFLNVLRRIFGYSSQNEFSLTCMAGLSVIGTLALYLSLFLPLGWMAQGIIVFPVLIYCLNSKNRMILVKQVKMLASSFSVGSYCLLGACLMMVLTLSSHAIIHPDTLAYHNQSIQWFKNYQAVPGIAHLRLELGFQSLWLASQAIFSFGSGIPNPSFYLNGSVLSWYFIFIVGQIDHSLIKRSMKNEPMTGSDLGWILIFIYSLSSWTQVRLTAASASPDFIASLFVLASIFTFSKTQGINNNRTGYQMLVILFCCVAVVVKLSSITILLLPILIIISIFKERKFTKVSFAVCLSVIIMLPWLTRNVIASGYPFYPSIFGDVFQVDWKFPESTLIGFQHYITAYARFPVTRSMADENLLLPFSKWIPIWWKNLSLPDQILILGTLLAFLFNLFSIKRSLGQLRKKNGMLFFILLIGVVVWFYKAPDPRFGSGFLIGLFYVLVSNLQVEFPIVIHKIMPFGYKLLLACLFFCIISYIGHRFFSFFKPSEVFWPSGIEHANYKQINCGNIIMNIPVAEDGPCGSIPVPCSLDSCREFKPRGNNLVDGFRNPN